jgi:hypothetical protein
MNYRAIITASLLAFSAGCGGAEFTLQSSPPAADSARDGNIVTVIDPTPQPDAQASLPTALPTATDVASDAGDAGDTGNTSDAGDGGDGACDAGAYVMATCGAMNPNGYIQFTAPVQYCSMYAPITGGLTSQGITVPPECLCNYTCDCLIASATDLCQSGGTFKNCQNDKGGLIVDCK